jgi:hypothetical protein
VDAHHIKHWAHGGETKLSNLLLLCRRHHRLVHEGGFRLELESDGRAVFRRPDGRVIPTVPKPQRGDHGQVRRLSREAGPNIGPDTSAALSGGASYDVGMAVEGLLARSGLLRPEGEDVSAETPSGPHGGPPGVPAS